MDLNYNDTYRKLMSLSRHSLSDNYVRAARFCADLQRDHGTTPIDYARAHMGRRRHRKGARR